MTSTLDPRIGTFAAEHVALGLLKFDRRYQTDHHSAQFIDKIAADWLPEKAGAIVASLRRRVPDLSRHDLEPSRGLQDEGGGYYVLDGQARVLAARQAGAESIFTVVYRDLDLEQEAEIFDWMNRVRRRPKLMETFRARELYQDPATVENPGWKSARASAACPGVSSVSERWTRFTHSPQPDCERFYGCS